MEELAVLDANQAARRLLGCILLRSMPNGEELSGRIVETESYEESDPAAHSYGGPRGRNMVMYGPAGFAYVYFTYGMHFCMNVVTGKAGRGEAVLIRALEPVNGVEIMQKNRKDRTDLTNGPAKLCQALAIDAALNGHDLRHPPLQLILKPALPAKEIIEATRIGIRHNADLLQRFYVKNNTYVSKI